MKKNFLNHNENNLDDWKEEEKRLRRRFIKCVFIIGIAIVLFALILCDIFGVFGEGAVVTKVITALTTFLALLKGSLELFLLYKKHKDDSHNTNDDSDNTKEE